MNRKRYIILDFDGTIADTTEMALAIYNRIAPEYNCRAINPGDIKTLRTKDPREFFGEYGISKSLLLLLVMRIRKELKTHIHEVKPVENIVLALHELKNAGYHLGIISSNSRANIGRFLDNNNLSGLIDFIYTSSKLYGKDRVMKGVINRYNIDKKCVVYVGDETRDIEASGKAGIPVIAAGWGLTAREGLLSLNPDLVIDTPLELPEAVRQIFDTL